MINSTINDYTVIKVLGQGGFGRVLLVRSPHSELFAAKVVEINKRIKEDVRNEAVLQGALRHPNILAVREYFFWSGEQFFVIISDYCEQGSLDRIIGQKGYNIQRLMVEIAEGLQYLHVEKNIVHRDMKPENILIKDGRPLIADLGISRLISSSGACTQVGTMTYIAPEMLEDDKYGFTVDIWALGLIFIELALGQRIREVLPGALPPSQRPNFPAEDLLNKINNIGTRKLVKSMLQRDCRSRPTISQVVESLGGKASNIDRKMPKQIEKLTPKKEETKPKTKATTTPKLAPQPSPSIKCPNGHNTSWSNFIRECITCRQEKTGWRCLSCRYYMCDGCCKTIFATDKCPNKHVLTWSAFSRPCPICQKELPGMRCQSCSYFPCDKCCHTTYQKQQCPSGHRTTWSSYGRVCINCTTSLSGWNCLTCSYYLCDECCKKAPIAQGNLTTKTNIRENPQGKGSCCSIF